MFERASTTLSTTRRWRSVGLGGSEESVKGFEEMSKGSNEDLLTKERAKGWGRLSLGSRRREEQMGGSVEGIGSVSSGQ